MRLEAVVLDDLPTQIDQNFRQPKTKLTEQVFHEIVASFLSDIAVNTKACVEELKLIKPTQVLVKC